MTNQIDKNGTPIDEDGNPVRRDGTRPGLIERIQPGEKYIVSAGVALPLAELSGQYNERTGTYHDPVIHSENVVYIKKTFGGKQDGAGRPELPPDEKKRRIVAYVEPAVAEWIEANGGNKFAAKKLAESHSASPVTTE